MRTKCLDCKQDFMDEEPVLWCIRCDAAVCEECGKVHFRSCREAAEEAREFEENRYAALGISPKDFA